ncbi:MAG: DUF1707 and DUF4870 domain-containing protein [Propionibacteriaceae bacterium]
MSAMYEHPSLKMYVTPEQRDRAEQWLQEAYADRRITEDEFDRRIGQVISSTTRKELNEAFYGLVTVPMPSQALGVHPAYQPMIRPETRQQAGRGAAGFAHFSVFFLWILGPGLVYALASTGSYAKREAAKAFNFQVISAISFATVGILSGITSFDLFEWMLPLMALLWFVLTIVGGAKALQGENWRNPVKSVLKLEILPEK